LKVIPGEKGSKILEVKYRKYVGYEKPRDKADGDADNA